MLAAPAKSTRTPSVGSPPIEANVMPVAGNMIFVARKSFTSEDCTSNGLTSE
eukprot:CAMPEP_0115842682 /NCGR_PEP_ID=MMETSP0287-20121206/7925_1 /TAXON_ID=412157 /ORGANISM="Chrysochromulina rotalis, Strain UIO044" /LENGTH=51 /DNA_ID=CAMNT_0003296357 /DNA_START=392 /DNA_END=547 /DNA_ORIENTATION=-